MPLNIKNSICLNQDILDAANHFKSLILSETQGMKHVLPRIEKTMRTMPLSSCIAVCVYVVFHHFYEQELHQEERFLDAFSNLKMTQLRHKSHYYEKQLKDALQDAKVKQRRLLSQSFFDLSKAIEQEKSVSAQITQLERDVAKSSQNTLSHFLFIADIVLYLEEHNELTKDQQHLKKKMLQDPITFIKDLVPSLLQLCELAYSKKEDVEAQEKAISQFNAVIANIVSILNIHMPEHEAWLLNLQHMLVERFIEKPCDTLPSSPSFVVC
ncbi:hypothetical protein [Legionella oakridgensis]|uniref:hypothetical protein n=1 Tax=Legionella oakridgensis TaxID=29423 RepID=UPI0003DE4869|nr:hypothetical protein [Legionella oakridgensis]ETO94351.1 hypothetical protein LOR_14c01450 [Legionella oakridgensis RV-2-2007]